MARIAWKSIESEDYANLLNKSKIELFDRFVADNDIIGWDEFGTDPEVVAHTLHKKSGYLKRMGRYSDLHFDHGRMYRLANNDRVYVCHPYLGDATEEYRKLLSWWAEENGLVAAVFDPTFDWYYHSNDPADFEATSLVIAHLPGVDILVSGTTE